MRINKLVKICEYCENEYDTLYGKQKYCSRSCASIIKNSKKKKTFYQFKCPNCQKEFESQEKRSKFCSHSCSTLYRKGKTLTEKHKQKVSESLKKYFKNNPNKKTSHSVAIKQGQSSQKGKHKKKYTSLLDFSKRTTSKIIKRMGIGCSICRWNKCTGDIHHINGRKIIDPDNHKNLTYLCPNCHREAHNNLIDKNDFINLESQIGDKWKNYYYGYYT